MSVPSVVFFMQYFNFFLLDLKFYIIVIGGSLLAYVSILVQVAALTLLERKVMGSIQRRRGPNIVGFSGLLQPFADGLKLATKETISPTLSNHFLFFFAPVLTFFLSLVGWSLIPTQELGAFSNPNIGILVVISISSLNIYGLLLSGWSSNNKYALLGAIRSAAQMISYEVVFGFIIMPVIMLAGSCNLYVIGCVASLQPAIYVLNFFPLGLLFFISILAETNRAPFDLPEAEAELVAGYNVEYSSFIFAMFFLGEYSSILLMSSLYVLFFLGSWSLIPSVFVSGTFSKIIIFDLKVIFVCFIFVWVRATFPRLRFDQLMSLCWKSLLPITFLLLFLYSFLFWFFYSA